jgi:hypothetical protein
MKNEGGNAETISNTQNWCNLTDISACLLLSISGCAGATNLCNLTDTCACFYYLLLVVQVPQIGVI